MSAIEPRRSTGAAAAGKAAFACAAIALLSALGIFLHSSAMSFETTRQMERSMASLAAFQRLAMDAIRAEVAGLHYLADGRTEYLAEARSALAAMQSTLDAAGAGALHDDPHQQHLDAVGDMGDIIAGYLALARARPGGMQGAATLPSGLRQMAADMVASELAGLAELRRKHAAWERRAYLGLGAAVAILATSLLFMAGSWRQARALPHLQERERAAELESANRLLTAENDERLRAQEALAASREALRKLYARQESVREQERKHMAREVHDGLGQDLYALKIAIAQLDRHAGKRNAPLQQGIAQALAQMDGLIASVRAVIYHLRPEVLDLGLIPAARWQVREFEKRSGIRCNFTCAATHCALPEDTAMALFRILQEALTNAMRHAGATEVSVTISRAPNALILRIADNGRGFTPCAETGESGLGLSGMRERALGVGGDFNLASAPGRGTALTVSVPLDPA